MTPRRVSGEWLPFQYRDFYDAPRLFLVEHDSLLLFDGRFSDELDDYPNDYAVAILDPSVREELGGSWAGFHQRVTRRVGSIRVSDVVFDDTRRKAIHAVTLTRIRTAPGAPEP